MAKKNKVRKITEAEYTAYLSSLECENSVKTVWKFGENREK